MVTPVWRWMTRPVARPEGRPELAEILPSFVIGEYPTPEDAEWLRVHQRVTTVFSLQDDADLASKGLVLEDLRNSYAQHGLSFHRVPVPDGDVETLAANLDAIVETLVELINRGERVYVHCNGGLNRAPTVAIAYLHVVQGMPLASARDFVRKRRYCAPYMTVLEARYGNRDDGRCDG